MEVRKQKSPPPNKHQTFNFEPTKKSKIDFPYFVWRKLKATTTKPF